MRGLGCSLIIFGLGGIILPFLGLQFRMMNAISDSGTPAESASVGLLLIGIILLALDSHYSQPRRYNAPLTRDGEDASGLNIAERESSLDIYQNLLLTLDEAINGTKKIIKIQDRRIEV